MKDPLIDQQSFETLLEVYQMLADADRGSKTLEPGDITYMSALMKATLKLNSGPEHSFEDRPKLLSKISVAVKKIGL